MSVEVTGDGFTNELDIKMKWKVGKRKGNILEKKSTVTTEKRTN